MDGEKIVVLSFAIIMFFLAVRYQKERKRSSVGSLMLWVFFISSAMSVVYYLNPLYSANYGITIGPYIYWIVLFLITLIPVIKYDKIKSTKLKFNIQLVNQVSILGLFVSLLPFIEYSTMLDMALSSSNISETFSDAYSEQQTIRISTLAVGFRLVVRFIYPFVLFGLIYIIKNGKINKLALAGAILTIITYNYEGILRGTRNGLLTVILNLILIIVILFPYLNQASKKRLIKSFLIIFLFLFAVFGFLSFARQSAIQEKSATFTEGTEKPFKLGRLLDY